MGLVDFSSQLQAADSVLDLACRLGDACLAEADDLSRMPLDAQTKKDLERIEAGVAAVPPGVWEEVIEDPSLFEQRVGPDLATQIKRAKPRQPLDFFGVLRGLCTKPVAEIYRATTDQVELNRGLPVPFATRKLKFKPTTSQAKLNRRGLLHPLPYTLFPYSAREPVRVILDFGHRERIDELTWGKEDGLSRIATVHPPRGGDVDFSTPRDGHFFDVRPKHWDRQAVLDLLADVKGEAEVAVLPELSLPTPGELGPELAKNPSAYPPIVVAGSAHCCDKAGGDGNEIRSNESWVYLDGKCVAVARKHHPFEETKSVGGTMLEEPLTEDLSSEQKTIMVLSGTHTRLAVVICADLLDLEIPRLLEAAGVNLLLVPAMTRKTGSFGPSLDRIAGFCQGVGVVANSRMADDGRPFLCFVTVPREDEAERLAALTGDGTESPPRIGILDPNKPLPSAVKWR